MLFFCTHLFLIIAMRMAGCTENNRPDDGLFHKWMLSDHHNGRSFSKSLWYTCCCNLLWVAKYSQHRCTLYYSFHVYMHVHMHWNFLTGKEASYVFQFESCFCLGEFFHILWSVTAPSVSCSSCPLEHFFDYIVCNVHLQYYAAGNIIMTQNLARSTECPLCGILLHRWNPGIIQTYALASCSLDQGYDGDACLGNASSLVFLICWRQFGDERTRRGRHGSGWPVLAMLVATHLCFACCRTLVPCAHCDSSSSSSSTWCHMMSWLQVCACPALIGCLLPAQV